MVTPPSAKKQMNKATCDDDYASYEIYYPKKNEEIKNFTDTLPCLSCGERLPSRGNIRSREYYEHCIKNCAKNRKRGKCNGV